MSNVSLGNGWSVAVVHRGFGTRRNGEAASGAGTTAILTALATRQEGA